MFWFTGIVITVFNYKLLSFLTSLWFLLLNIFWYEIKHESDAWCFKIQYLIYWRFKVQWFCIHDQIKRSNRLEVRFNYFHNVIKSTKIHHFVLVLNEIAINKKVNGVINFLCMLVGDIHYLYFCCFVLILKSFYIKNKSFPCIKWMCKKINIIILPIIVCAFKSFLT
jgi:hypothetical protein